MHRVIAGFLKTFCEETFVDAALEEDKRFELFSNYCMIKSFYPEEIDASTITSEEDDSGIDGICFIIDGEIATTVAEADSILKRPKRNVPVDIYFIQTKTSDTYDRGEILKFGDGVCDFVADTPQLPQGDFIRQQRAIFDLLVDNVSKITNGRPDVYLKYVCTSNNPVATEIEATRANIIRDVNDTGFFNSVDFEFVGLQQLIQLWDKTRHTISAVMQTKQLSPYPEMPGVTESYLAIVPLRSFVENVLMDGDGKLRVHIFEENVRAFLGGSNPVNKQIRDTLSDPEAQKQFAILNNGITIISPDVRVQSDKVSMENYQIVNGCQTSNVLFENYELLIPESTITVKVIEATDPDVIADVVRATNSQSKVDETQFLSFTNLIRRLERYFATTEDIPGQETKLYFERRNGQYKDAGVPKRRVCSIPETCRAVGAMFLRKPELAYRYPTKMISDPYDKLLNDKNKEIIYYTAALVLYRFKLLASNGRIDSKYSIYKWHILMILSYVSDDKAMPSIQNKKIEGFCKKIIKVCSQSDDECLALFNRAIAVLEAVGLKESRDDIRSVAYTQSILQYCNQQLQQG
jgi:hypothetical protein